MARTRDGAGYGVAVKKRHRTAFAAQRLGALGALIRSVGTNSHRFAHTGQMQNIDYDAAQGAPAAALSAPDADQLARALAYGKPAKEAIQLIIMNALLLTGGMLRIALRGLISRLFLKQSGV